MVIDFPWRPVKRSGVYFYARDSVRVWRRTRFAIIVCNRPKRLHARYSLDLHLANKILTKQYARIYSNLSLSKINTYYIQ